MDTSNDYYTVLGVDAQASASSIKAAFKKLALQYHPDVYKGADAQERMRILLQAYQTLNDPVARREYDSQRSGARATTLNGAASRTGSRSANVSAQQGRYAFPDLGLPLSAPLTLKVNDITYQLTPTQAEHLKWDGMLRGEMLASAADSSYCCQRCKHSWSEQVGRGDAPRVCPACSARDWAEYLLLRCIHCQAVFASEELHDPLRGQSLYHPYELFPLCPHCRRSHWCPTENARVAVLRAKAARQRALLVSGLIGACLVVVALIALVLLH